MATLTRVLRKFAIEPSLRVSVTGCISGASTTGPQASMPAAKATAIAAKSTRTLRRLSACSVRVDRGKAEDFMPRSLSARRTGGNP